MKQVGKCSVCSHNCRGNECPSCLNRIEDISYERNWTYERALAFVKSDKSQMVQRFVAEEVSRQRYIARHSRPITSSQMVFAPNKTVSPFQLRLRRA